MGNESICGKCYRGQIVGGKCTVCGFQENKKHTTNALPNGIWLNNGRYRILACLGEGGYGITYRALDTHKRQEIAIKEFFPAHALERSGNRMDALRKAQYSEDALDHMRMRFNEEAKLLIDLNTTREIVNVYHSFEENKTAYYTMELLQGMDMQKKLRQYGQMSWQELSSIVIQILRALYAIHEKGYIHRDIAPDNIFITHNGAVQLIDFGNARRYSVNQQMTVALKDKFAPREQYDSRGKQGPWTDIYSLSVTIYYALTGTLPPKATERVTDGDGLPMLHTVAQVPEAVSRAVRIGMSADENRRYQKIEDFAKAMYPEQRVIKPYPGEPRGPATLCCAQGVMRGFRVILSRGQILTIGRGWGKSVQYPDGTNGVSRNQCSILLQANGSVYVKDDGSRYGTMVNGQLLRPGCWELLKQGYVIAFGRERYVLY